MPEPTIPDRLAFAVDDLPAITALGPYSIDRLLKSGELLSRQCGRRVIVLRSDLEGFLNSLPVKGPSK